MKKLLTNIICLLFLLLLIPTVVLAEDSCENMKARIKSISVENSEGEVIETKDPKYDDQNISLDLKFYKLHSNVRYKVTVKNDSNDSYYIDSQDILKNYVHYRIELIDNNNQIKPNGETSFYLIAAYDKEVPPEEITGDSYTDNNKVEFLVTDVPISGVVNPTTSHSKLFVIFILSIVALGLVYQHKLGKKESLSLFILGAFLLPYAINGMCKYNINLATNVEIKNKDINVCAYDGEVTKGAEYVNGDYTYRYKQKKTENGWVDIVEDGWGVALTTNNTFKPIESSVCDAVNQKPVVERSYMERTPREELDYLTTSSNFRNGFENGVTATLFEKLTILNNKTIPSYAIKSWDVSNKRNGSIQAWYTDEDSDGKFELYIGSNGGVLANPDMSYYFYGFENIEETKDLNNLDVSGVVNMNGFMGAYAQNCNKFEIDVSKWDTRNVSDMSILFTNTGINADTFIIKGLNKWNVSNVTTMSGMFAGAGRFANKFSIGQLTSWDTRKVTNMSQMFNYAGENATDWESLGEFNVYEANIGGQYIIAGMFAYCQNANLTLNLHKNPTGYSYAFDTAATKQGSKITVNYSEEVTNIDRIIATKSNSSNVVKGEIIQ